MIEDKFGSLRSWTNYYPFKHYAVEVWWLDNLLKAEKIDREVYLTYCARIGIGFARRLGDVRAAQRFEKELAMQAAATVAARSLQRNLRPVKQYEAVEEFLGLFSGAPLHRRPLLAIVGGTNLGKSMLAANVLQRLGEIVGAPEYVEITVEMNEHLDVSDFDVRRHSGILLDGVGDAFILKANRESLQGRAKLSKGARSATMMYSYVYTL